MRFKFSLFHLLNLDTVVGALAVAIAFSGLPDGKTALNFPTVIALACAVFCICMSNDLISHPAKENSKKDTWIRSNQSSLQKAVAVVGAGLAVALWFVPEQLYAPGIVIALLSGVYLLGQRYLPSGSSLRRWKELGSASLFAAGIWGSNWILIKDDDWITLSLGLIFLCVVLQNTLLYSHFDVLKNKKRQNLAKALGKSFATRTILLIAIVVVGIVVLLCWQSESRYIQRLAILFALMSVLQYWMMDHYKGYSKYDYYRTTGDLIYLIPILVV